MLGLYLSAELDGVTALEPMDSVGDPYYYTFTVRCGACRELHDRPVRFQQHELVEVPNTRAQAHLVMKCRSCGKPGTAVVVPVKNAAYLAEDGRKLVCKFDCRGLQLEQFIPDGPFQARSAAKGQTIQLEFEEGEWYDYDEPAQCEVSITNLDWTVAKTA